MWEILRHLLRKHETILKEVDQMMVSSRLGPLPSEIRAEYEHKLAEQRAASEAVIAANEARFAASEARFAEQRAADEARFAEQQAASEARFAASEAKLEQLTEQKAADEAVIAALKAQLLAAGIQPQTAA